MMAWAYIYLYKPLCMGEVAKYVINTGTPVHHSAVTSSHNGTMILFDNAGCVTCQLSRG